MSAEHLRLLEVNRLQRPPRLEVDEEGVREGEHDVRVFAVQDVREEGEQEDDVGGPEDPPVELGIRPDDGHVRENGGNELPILVMRDAKGLLRRVEQEEARHDSKDEQQDDRCVEEPLVHELLRPDDIPAE